MLRFFLPAFFPLACVAWAQPDAALLGELRHGGYVLYLRHASTDFSQKMETARLAFGKAQPMQEARGGPSRTDDAKRYEGLRKLLSTPLPKGENVVISSHGNPFHAVAGPPYLAEGEIAVVRPQGDSAFAVVGRIRLQDWELLQ